MLSKVDQSESSTLQSLHGCLHLIAENVEKLGFFVPATARALDALDDFSNLLKSHAQTTKLEIQSLEISAQMLSVTSEPSNIMDGQQRDDLFKEIAKLTQELTALQHQADELYQRKEALLQQVNAAKLRVSQPQPPPPVPQQQPRPSLKSLDGFANSSSTVSSATAGLGASSFEGMSSVAHPTYVGVLSSPASSDATTTAAAVWGDFGDTTSPSSEQEDRTSESVQRIDSNPFELGVSTTAAADSVPVADAAGSTADFGWSDFP